MKNRLNLTVLVLVVCGLSVARMMAQDVAPPAPVAMAQYSAQQLDQLLGPIALYPDPLISQILPAASLPTQIVLADRYVSGGGDPNAIEQQPWDASVQAVAHYPSILKWLDDNLTWTTALGQAFLNQQQDVMDSIQRLRSDALSRGNLVSTPQQQIVQDGGTIEILPADPETIYVPQYDPDTVYYETATGFPFITFAVGFPLGVWLNCDFDWQRHHLIVWDHDHPRPPDWWHRAPADRRQYLGHQVNVWHPQDRNHVVPAGHEDRGWGDRAPEHSADVHAVPPHDAGHNLPVHTEPPHNVPHSEPPHMVPPPAHLAPPQHIEPPSRPIGGNSPYLGTQNAQDTRTFSDRGAQSRGLPPAPRPAPAPPQHYSPPPSNNGNHGDNGQRKR